MNRFAVLLAGALLSLVVVTACDKDDDPVQPAQPVTYTGQSTALGQGQITVYERAAVDGSLLAIGIRFDESALNGLPTDPTELSLMLPKKVSTSPFDHIGFDWNPQGHEPDPIYTVPHFDVHFYCVDAQTKAAVVPGPDSLLPASQYMPVDYFSTYAAAPNMGTHFIDGMAPELHGVPFDKTFIYGFYRGDLFFMEPMITKAYFESKPNATIDIKQPTAFQKTGKAFPMQYTVKYDAGTKQYTVELTSMKMH